MRHADSPAIPTPRPHVLVVEDEDDLRQRLNVILAREGFRVTTLPRGAEAVGDVKRRRPDLLLLDLVLPDIDGVELCMRIKAEPDSADIPIVALAEHDHEQHVVHVFEAGADDFVIKPFSPRVLVARIRAVLRGRRLQDAADDDDTLRVNGLSISRQRHEVFIGDRTVELTATEFRLLWLMASDPGRVFPREQLIRAIHGEGVVVTDRSIDVLILGIRRKFAEHSELIQTIRGVGYRLNDDAPA